MTPTRKCLSEVQPIDAEDEMDHVEGLSREELDAVKVDQVGGNPPANAQQQADDEAEAWMGQWGKGTKVEPLIWPSDMRDDLARILREELIEASNTFPNHTGLGWDRLHPKAIGRLTNGTADLLVRVLMICEEEGEWPEAVELIIIALLPKTDGGFRPIGLIPFLPRIWSRARRRCAREWEAKNPRPWLYAGKAKGANVAAWKQSMTAEAAAAARSTVHYAQALLDLVKAFDRIPLWLLVREAVALGYPLKVLRLSIAVYKMTRVIRIGGVVSHSVRALRGITAGSGFATSEMRLIMMRAVDAAVKQFPRVNPTLFVDDLAADVTGPWKHVVKQLGGFIEAVATFVITTGQELSGTKSLCTASLKELGKELCDRWAKAGISIQYKDRVRALGAGLGAGVRRNMLVLKE